MSTNQVLVVRYPGRGHINPLLSLCHLLSSKLNQHNHNTTVFTVVVTEEWLGLLSQNVVQPNVQFVTIPNVLPSEHIRGSDMISFITAVRDNMAGPFEEVLDKMEISKVTLIVADAIMMWPFEVANKRNIPVAAYYPMSGEMFSVMHHVDLIESNSNQLHADVSERGKQSIDYIPGISSLTIADLPMLFHGGIGHIYKNVINNLFDTVNKANYLLISTVYDLEPKVIDALRVRLQIPVYTAGPNIPYSQNRPNTSLDQPAYLTWLDSKPPRTVLYVSLGSFLSVSSHEMDEIAAGLTQSGANFLWVARGETSHLKEMCGEKGMVVEWCDQLRVLSHSSIGGFFTHCGWNSVKESLFSGIPMLTFPILFDQPVISKEIIEDWKIGKNMRKEVQVFKADKIAEVVRVFMDSKSVERIEMMARAKKLQKACQESVVEGGSAYKDLDAFVKEIVKGHSK